MTFKNPLQYLSQFYARFFSASFPIFKYIWPSWSDSLFWSGHPVTFTNFARTVKVAFVAAFPIIFFLPLWRKSVKKNAQTYLYKYFYVSAAIQVLSVKFLSDQEVAYITLQINGYKVSFSIVPNCIYFSLWSSSTQRSA